MYDFLKYEVRQERVGVLTLSNPAAMNALNGQVIAELRLFLDGLEKELAEKESGSRVEVLVITGAGKAFVAGADIRAMEKMNQEEASEFALEAVEVFRRIECLPVPVIAAVNGYALGGGCELAMACDIRYAADTALFGQPEVSLGITPGFSGTFRLMKLVGESAAKELIYTGKLIKAAQAAELGLVNRVVPAAELLDYALEQALAICKNSAYAVAKSKEMINSYYSMDTTEALQAEISGFASCFERAGQRQRMRAFLEKKKSK